MSEDADKEDRTEDPTQRKLDQATEKGDVPKSQEIGTFFVLCGFTLALLVGAGWSARESLVSLRAFLMNAHQVPADGAGFMQVTRQGVLTGFMALGMPFAFILCAGLAGAVLQHRPLWTFDPMMPKFDRINPLSGVKRLFGKEAWVNFAKGLAKTGLIGVVIWLTLWNEHDRLENFAEMDVAALLPAALSLAIRLMGSVLALFAIVAIGDFVWQRFSWYQRQKMTKQEMKEEFKNSEGNPEVKAKLRQIRASRVRKRMMAAVPKATVIITNPTHFAVALQYEPGMAAPLCLAKGVDTMALKIREVAGEHSVPIIENPPLARALYATVEIDAEIPVEHYKAVAEVIGYVLRLKGRRA
ncbi:MULTISPECIES: flagellar biosynthesis protein FlhB [unclassified Bosea (in: a-proteobacteria)]|uniref:flagellar biosynthesis protein FlhB n=1 Tax=unclassified Bosea (in: a-proteobacteria) TaxID=2653178 RepID=UPI00095479B4|nr:MULTISPECIES: flagellar biosynthesis protein FlhB [unclassified Bosea (in: a-proteobacteria)]TAJ30913.1 MAG: flagellar biosynthesis protein FlhB [Bosea sp. (in: a-proteobacteria)]SIQ22447.1 flagellar biosynthetic protein FlhB [Bosea sp. TND4EK4]